MTSANAKEKGLEEPEEEEEEKGQKAESGIQLKDAESILISRGPSPSVSDVDAERSLQNERKQRAMVVPEKTAWSMVSATISSGFTLGERYWSPYKHVADLYLECRRWMQARRMVQHARETIAFVNQEVMPVLLLVQDQESRLKAELARLEREIEAALLQKGDSPSPVSLVALVNLYKQFIHVREHYNDYASYSQMCKNVMEVLLKEGVGTRVVNVMESSARNRLLQISQQRWTEMGANFSTRSLNLREISRNIQRINDQSIEATNMAFREDRAATQEQNLNLVADMRRDFGYVFQSHSSSSSSASSFNK